MIPCCLSFSPETAPAATHHGSGAGWSAAASTKSLPTEVAGVLRRVTLPAKPALLAATAPHLRLTALRARGSTELVSSTTTFGIALKIPALRTISAETTPAATHHGWKAALSAAAPTKSLPTEVAGALRGITLRGKPALLAATATHPGLAILRAGITGESTPPAKVARRSLGTMFTIAGPRWSWLDGSVAKFCAPALDHALACLLGIRVALRRVVLSVKVHGADEQRRRRSHRTRHH